MSFLTKLKKKLKPSGLEGKQFGPAELCFDSLSLRTRLRKIDAQQPFSYLPIIKRLSFHSVIERSRNEGEVRYGIYDTLVDSCFAPPLKIGRHVVAGMTA
ncbi:MAG: hypothetical protein AAF554_17485 [Bacteroidota bacterium]